MASYLSRSYETNCRIESSNTELLNNFLESMHNIEVNSTQGETVPIGPIGTYKTQYGGQWMGGSGTLTNPCRLRWDSGPIYGGSNIIHSMSGNTFKTSTVSRSYFLIEMYILKFLI